MRKDISYYDLEELACVILGLDYDKIVNDGMESMISDSLNDKFGISMSQFVDLVKALLPLTMPVQSPITKQWFHCLGTQEVDWWRAIVKMMASKS